MCILLWVVGSLFLSSVSNNILNSSCQCVSPINNDIRTFRHIKIVGDANPFDAEWNGYFQNRELLIKMKSVTHYIGKVSKQQNGKCTQCGQPIQAEEKHHLHYIDGDKTHRRVKNVLMIHKTCKKAFGIIKSKHIPGASIDMGVCNA